MTEFRLLAVVEVPQADRVVCQAPGCKHPVYKRIHVVQKDGQLTVLGSEFLRHRLPRGSQPLLFGANRCRLRATRDLKPCCFRSSRSIALAAWTPIKLGGKVWCCTMSRNVFGECLRPFSALLWCAFARCNGCCRLLHQIPWCAEGKESHSTASP